MGLKTKFAAVSLAVLTVAGAGIYAAVRGDGSRPLADHTVMQPSAERLSQVAFLDKHFSMRETSDSFQERFHALAKDLSRPEVSRNVQERLVIIGNEINGKGNGRVSSITDMKLQQRLSDAFYGVIGDGFDGLRKGNEAKFDSTIKQPQHEDIYVTYRDFKNSENTWRRTANIAPIAVPVVDRGEVSANVILVQEKNLPPQNGQIYIPADNGRPQFKGFTGEGRRLKGMEEKNEREQRQVQSSYGANNYGFGRQTEDVEAQLRDLPGVFTGQALTSMAIIGREMANLSGDAKLRTDLLKQINDLERDAAGVGKDEMTAQGARTLAKVNTNNPEVLKILMRGHQLAQWMVAPAQKQLFEKALLSRAKNSPQTKAGINGAANIDFINLSSYRILRQKNWLPAPTPKNELKR